MKVNNKERSNMHSPSPHGGIPQRNSGFRFPLLKIQNYPRFLLLQLHSLEHSFAGFTYCQKFCLFYCLLSWYIQLFSLSPPPPIIFQHIKVACHHLTVIQTCALMNCVSSWYEICDWQGVCVSNKSSPVLTLLSTGDGGVALFNVLPGGRSAAKGSSETKTINPPRDSLKADTLFGVETWKTRNTVWIESENQKMSNNSY